MKHLTFFNSLFLLTCGIFFLLTSCKEEDPCENEKRISADFKVQEDVGLLGLFEQDTFGSGQDIYFEAKEDLAGYKWKIGTDPTIFTKKAFSLYFESYHLGKIDVTLIAGKTPTTMQQLCFPDEDGVDTIRKTITLIHPSQVPIWGKYKGHDASTPNIEYIIELDKNRGKMRNFPNHCQEGKPFETQWINIYLGTFMFQVAQGGNLSDCGSPSGVGKLAPNRKDLTIQYKITRQGKRVDETFIGTKIP